MHTVLVWILWLSTAHAQHLALEREDVAPVLASHSVLATPHGGELVFYTHDLGTGSDRTLYVATGGVTRVEPHTTPVLDVVACGGARWLLSLRRVGTSLRFAVETAGREVWTHTVPSGVVPNVSLDCAGDQAIATWVAEGELHGAGLTPTGSTSLWSLRVWNRGTQGGVSVEGSSPSTLVVAIEPWTAPAEVLRVEGGRVTHRHVLGRTDGVRLTVAGPVIVVASSEQGGSARLTALSSADLAPRATATIPPSEPGRRVSVHAIWPGPLVVIEVGEQWEGPDMVAIPQGPSEPDRPEPAYHSHVSLRTFDPATGALGAPIDLRASQPAAGGWLGDRLVLLSPAERAGISGGVVQLRHARLRRYRIVR